MRVGRTRSSTTGARSASFAGRPETRARMPWWPLARTASAALSSRASAGRALPSPTSGTTTWTTAAGASAERERAGAAGGVEEARGLGRGGEPAEHALRGAADGDELELGVGHVREVRAD